jgi:hypothetical protein
MSPYVLDDTAPQTAQRFASLKACYHPVTIHQLQGIAVCSGWSCLEAEDVVALGPSREQAVAMANA